MRARIAAAVVALAAVLAIWLALASMAFIWVHGFWQIYPWPDKLWMWARYAMEASSHPIVHQWLIITGIVAAVPVLATGVLVVVVIRRAVANSASLYGKTGWATKVQMRATGWQLRSRL